MFFRKKIHKIIEEKFSFLLSYGFGIKKYQKGGDLEIYYSKNGISIGILYYCGINNSYEKLYTLDLIITKNGIRENFFKCHYIFDKQELHKLENNINNKSITEQLHFYSLFLKNNINYLL